MPDSAPQWATEPQLAAETPSQDDPWTATDQPATDQPGEDGEPGEDDERRSTARRAVMSVLQKMAGPSALPRPGQVDAVAALLGDRQRVLVVQATGWGKSVVYWAAASALRARGEGPTVVVSPLLALMRDQIGAAAGAGLNAVTVNSANPQDWQQVFDDLAADRVDVLLISPERLANPRFTEVALPLLRSAGMLVIDEAHCISDWGFDFRPDYQRVTRMLMQLRAGTPVLATTATANERVTADVAAQLGDRTAVLRGPLARTSLELSVVPGLSTIQRYAWVNDALRRLDGSGIVYCSTVAEANSLSGFLRSEGHNVEAYTGQLEPQARQRIEDALRDNAVKAVVATSALGMGYDKPDLAFCIHVGSPSSPVAYYQQVGRAGRGLDRATGVLLPAGKTDERLWEYFATATMPDPDLADRLLAAVSGRSASVIDLEEATGARRGRVELMLKQLRVDGAVDRDGSGWRATGRPWAFDADKYGRIIEARRAEADLMRHYARGDSCLMQVLIDALDDPAAAPCGRCSVCTGRFPEPGKAPTAESEAQAREFLRTASHDLQPRKLWPRGVSRRGRIVGAEPGRALAFADDPGWAEVVAELRSRDCDPSDELLDAIVGLLHRWRPQRPDVLVPLPAPGQMHRITAIADRLGQRLRVPVIGALEWHGTEPIPAGQPSQAHVRLIESHLRLTGVPLRGRIQLIAADGRSLWTVTVAAALLREAGAESVVPLVIHRSP